MKSQKATRSYSIRLFVDTFKRLCFRWIHALYYATKEYNVFEAMKKTQSTLSKLQSRIMNGDYQAASLAFDQLEEYDRLTNEWIND